MGGMCSKVSNDNQPRRRSYEDQSRKSSSESDQLSEEEWNKKWGIERKDTDLHAKALRLLRSNEVFSFVCGGESELEVEPWKCNQLYEYFEAADCLKVTF
jgi:hypothetical protein